MTYITLHLAKRRMGKKYNAKSPNVSRKNIKSQQIIKYYKM